MVRVLFDKVSGGLRRRPEMPPAVKEDFELLLANCSSPTALLWIEEGDGG